MEYKRIIKHEDHIIWESEWSKELPKTPWNDLIEVYGTNTMNRVTISFYTKKVKSEVEIER